MFSRVDTTVDAPQAIYVAPTRELAIQTFHVARRLGKYTGVKQQVLVRGAADSAHPESDETGQLVFGTPGTLLHMMERKRLKLSAVKVRWPACAHCHGVCITRHGRAHAAARAG